MATPAPLPPTPRVGFLEYVEHHVPYKAKLAGALVVLAGLVLGTNYVLDLRARSGELAQKVSTLEQKYQALGPAAVAGNQVAPQKDLNAVAQRMLDPAVLAYMQQQGAAIASLTQAVGEIKGQISAQKPLASSFDGKQDQAGVLAGYTLEESRTSGPPLAAVNLNYDPKQTNPNLAFRGTTWTHYGEEFHVKVSDWQKSKDGGLKTALQLSRTVYKVNASDPNQRTALGTEEIPITGADTVIGPKGLAADLPKIPRWTATVGVTRDGLTSSTNGYQPAALLDYRITNRLGVSAGAVNKGGFLGMSVRFGGPR